MFLHRQTFCIRIYRQLLDVWKASWSLVEFSWCSQWWTLPAAQVVCWGSPHRAAGLPPSPGEARDVSFSETRQTDRAPICRTGGPRKYQEIIFLLKTLHFPTHFHGEIVADLNAVTDDTTSLGAAIEGVRERGVEALYLGTEEAATVRASG